MKIMWMGVPSEHNTSYGVQTGLYTRMLRDMGHDVTIAGVLIGSRCYDNADGILTLPAGPRSCMGGDFIQQHFERIKPDFILSMFDTFVVSEETMKPLPWVAWQVIDSYPVNPIIRKFLDIPKMNLAMSKFGQKTMEDVGVKSHYIPCCFDIKQYFPEDRAACRQQLAKTWKVELNDETFLVVMNAANMSKPCRKNFSSAFAGFAEFRKSHPNSLLYCHTEVSGTLQNGENVIATARACGLTPESVLFPDQYDYIYNRLPSEYLRTVYSAADLYLCSSFGEGFGIPIVEAQACGCPVAVTNWTASSEVVTKDAQLLEGPLWAFLAGTFWKLVPPENVARCMCFQAKTPSSPTEKALRSEEMQRRYGLAAVQTECVEPMLQAVEKEMGTWRKE